VQVLGGERWQAEVTSKRLQLQIEENNRAIPSSNTEPLHVGKLLSWCSNNNKNLVLWCNVLDIFLLYPQTLDPATLETTTKSAEPKIAGLAFLTETYVLNKSIPFNDISENDGNFFPFEQPSKFFGMIYLSRQDNIST
jgi:hypothetical protein